MYTQAGQISEEGDLFAKKGHLCEKVQVRTGLQNHHGVFLAINNAVETFESEKRTHCEFLFCLKSLMRIRFLGATLDPADRLFDVDWANEFGF